MELLEEVRLKLFYEDCVLCGSAKQFTVAILKFDNSLAYVCKLCCNYCTAQNCQKCQSQNEFLVDLLCRRCSFDTHTFNK